MEYVLGQLRLYGVLLRSSPSPGRRIYVDLSEIARDPVRQERDGRVGPFSTRRTFPTASLSRDLLVCLVLGCLSPFLERLSDLFGPRQARQCGVRQTYSRK